MSDREARKVVLITGASGGLGQALVKQFVSDDWQVACGTRGNSHTAKTRNEFPVELDVTQPEEVRAAVSAIVQRFGRIDALINNAGFSLDASLAQMNEKDWDEVMAVNLRGAFLCCKAVARHMIRQRDGHIVNISSHAARRGPRGQANYAAAKAGLVGLTQSLARELGPRNVRVNAIFPGVMPTKMTAGFSADRLDEFAKANALGRINSVEEVARFITFLTATENISGQVFALDSRIASWV
jgi:3-oxoacyl-[acyl-carrier protein] reductase